MVRIDEETPGQEDWTWCQSANHKLERFSRARFTCGGSTRLIPDTISFFNLIFYWLFWGEFHIKYPKLSPSISAPHSHNIPQKEKWKKLIQNKTNNPVHTSIFPIPQPLHSPWCPWELWWGHGTFWSMFWVKCTHKEDLVGWYSFPFGLAFIMSKYFWVISELYESVFKNNIIFINSLRSA